MLSPLPGMLTGSYRGRVPATRGSNWQKHAPRVRDVP
jgi:hypothetical protein